MGVSKKLAPQVKGNSAQTEKTPHIGIVANDPYLEPFEKTGSRYSYPNGYQSYKYWAWDMVIKFGDESTYITMANYFSRSNFRSVYGDVESLIESYSKLVKK